MPAVILDDLRAHLNITDPSDDDELAVHLAAAIETVEGIVGSLSVQTVTETVKSYNGTALLGQGRVTAITSPEGLTLNGPAGIVSGLTSVLTEVTYTAGAEPTNAQALAVLIIAAHLWETQRGPAVSPLADEFQQVQGLGYAIPKRARELLAATALGPTVA